MPREYMVSTSAAYAGSSSAARESASGTFGILLPFNPDAAAHNVGACVVWIYGQRFVCLGKGHHQQDWPASQKLPDQRECRADPGSRATVCRGQLPEGRCLQTSATGRFRASASAITLLLAAAIAAALPVRCAACAASSRFRSSTSAAFRACCLTGLAVWEKTPIEGQPWLWMRFRFRKTK